MLDMVITEEMIRSGKKTSLGGVVCPQEIGNEIYLHTAIRMDKDDFIDGGTGDKNLYRLKRCFDNLSVHMREVVFSFKGVSFAEDYGTLTFAAPKEWQCLDEIPLPLQPQMALEIFVELLKFIDNYRKCHLNDNQYNPLLFICRESVYLQRDFNGRLKVNFLPLPHDPQAMYAGMPREIYTKTADISSDVCMAAYLYLLLKYGDDRPFDPEKITHIDHLAERCLSPFTFRRPSIDELLAAASGEEDPSVPQGGGNEKPIIVIGEKPNPSRPPRQKPKKGILDTVKRKFSQKPKTKGRISKAKDQFDDMFSTEAADAREENL